MPVGSRTQAAAGRGPRTFRSPTAVAIWWVWLLFAAANLIDLAVQGRDHLSLVAAAIVVAATGIAYVTAQRPRIVADDAGITVRNPLRDYHVGWAWVTKVDLTDLLRLHCATGSQAGAAPASTGTASGKPPGGTGPDRAGHTGSKVICAWAVHYSRRRTFIAETRARRASARAGSPRTPFGLPYGGSRGPGYAGTQAAPAAPVAEAEAEKTARVLSEYASAARAEVVWAAGTDRPDAPAGPGELRHTGWLDPLTSTWSGRAIAALAIPALILLAAALL